MVTKEDLIAFETDIAQCFNDGKIRAPIHLYSGNEDQMIEIFKAVQKDDYICCTWRNHYQCLLKGMPAAELKEKILRGKSMVMTSKEHNIICSSIVGGIPSIATGIAWGLKLQGSPNRVWCFVGDMSMETGAFHEAYKYSRGHNLPIMWVVEDNGKSVETPTKEVWGLEGNGQPNILYYKYENTKYPHAGAGVRVQF